MSAIFSDPLFFGGLFNPDIKANKNTFLNLGQGSPAPPPPPPGLPPSISPVLQKIPGSNPDTTLFISFNVSSVQGTAPITYTLAWGTGGTLPNQAVLTVNGNDYTTLVTGLTPNTTYSFQLTMTNAYGVDIGIVYDFQTDPTPPPPPPSDPSGPPTTPILLGPTNASITVTFDVAGITGTAPLVFSALYGTVAQGPVNPVQADFLQDTLYEATAIDLLPNTAYVFRSKVVSAVGMYLSAQSEPFTTLQ